MPARGGSSRGPADEEAMLEGQNDDQLDGLHQKLKALHAVTRDIHDDSRGQNTMLDGTGQSFDSFRATLSSTADRFGRTIGASQSQSRTILYFIGGAVVLFLLYKIFA